jgi:chromosome segregation ATPase
LTIYNTVGKSAIVAAIQLCLGVTARTTGRGTSLGGLIREGSDEPAIMQVTLLNEGVDAYKPDLYGKRITVERKILNRQGGGGYRLLDENGVVRSKSLSVVEYVEILALVSVQDLKICVIRFNYRLCLKRSVSSRAFCGPSISTATTPAVF